MRGQVDPRSQMFSYFSPESRGPAEHPLRSIKAHTDRVLAELSDPLEALYSTTGRPSIPPEQLLKAQLLMALYSVRSDRLFCQMLDYNILFRWFLDMSLDDAGLDARTTRHASYRISQRKRKRVEEIFGWMKAYGGLRRTRIRGIARVQLHAHLVGAAYNFLRLSRLQPATG